MPIILSDKNDVDLIIEEEKEKWVWATLINIGFQYNKKDDQYVMREKLLQQGLEVITVSNGEVEIFRNKELVATWKKPKIITKQDEYKVPYVEIHIET